MSNPVFVCGATGAQGGAVARHLRKANIPVHTLARDPSSPKAKKLKNIGVTIFPGSYEDEDALKAALKDTKSAFLNFMLNLDPDDPHNELAQVDAVLAAAKEAGVEHIVYTSAFGVDEKAPLPPGLDPEGLGAMFMKTKAEAVGKVIDAGFKSYTILRPAKFMSDFIGAGAVWFGGLTTTGVFETAFQEGVGVEFVDMEDIGAFGAAALTNRERFAGKKVDVFSEKVPIERAIRIVAGVTGKKLSARFLSEVEVKERKDAGDLFIQIQSLMRNGLAPGDIEGVRGWGVPLGSFEAFAERERGLLVETYAQVPDDK